jgi:YidC/Oxa1 family membrane protein insertase
VNSESRSLLAIASCVVLYLGYQQYLSWKYPDLNKPSQVASSSQSSSPSATKPAGETQPQAAGSAVAAGESVLQPGQQATAVATLAPENLTLETDTVTWRFSQANGSVETVTLKNYKATKDTNSGPVELFDSPLALQGTLDIKGLSPAQGPFNAERQGRTLKFWRDVGQIRVTQEFSIPEQGYGANLKVSFTNLGQAPVDLTGGLLAHTEITPKKASSVMGFLPGAVTARDQVLYNVDGSTKWVDLEKMCKGDDEAVKVSSEPVGYLGIDRHYFLAVIEPTAKSSSTRIEIPAASQAACQVSMLNFDALGAVKPGEAASMDYKLYFGPKELSAMTAHNPSLGSAMHLGVFDFIARPLLLIIEGFYKILGNYGVAIILLTILLKVLFYPLVRASSTSMHRMKKLNPQMQAIRDKWKDDKQRQQQELIKFMSQNKINPMKGCLPILPQIPVFFAFYQVLQNSISLRHAPFFGWIHDLSVMDPFIVTPLLMGVAMFAQQKLTPTTGMDKTQEKILMFMPIMFTAMMLTLPAGLTLYMLTNTVVGIAQQKWLYRRLDKLEA